MDFLFKINAFKVGEGLLRPEDLRVPETPGVQARQRQGVYLRSYPRCPISSQEFQVREIRLLHEDHRLQHEDR